MRNSLNNVADLHLLMAVPNCGYFEVLLPDAAQKQGLIEDIEVEGRPGACPRRAEPRC